MIANLDQTVLGHCPPPQSLVYHIYLCFPHYVQLLSHVVVSWVLWPKVGVNFSFDTRDTAAICLAPWLFRSPRLARLLAPASVGAFIQLLWSPDSSFSFSYSGLSLCTILTGLRLAFYFYALFGFLLWHILAAVCREFTTIKTLLSYETRLGRNVLCTLASQWRRLHCSKVSYFG